jgi:hypothetical protein
MGINRKPAKPRPFVQDWQAAPAEISTVLCWLAESAYPAALRRKLDDLGFRLRWHGFLSVACPIWERSAPIWVQLESRLWPAFGKKKAGGCNRQRAGELAVASGEIRVS